MEPKSDKTQAFYRWVDASGRVHVVSSLDAVPAAERARAERVTLSGATALGEVPRSPSLTTSPAAWRLDFGSFGLGFGAAAVLALLLRLFPNAGRSVTRIAVVLGIAAVLGALYLGSIRRTAGVGDDNALASPSALIQDAKDAVQKLNDRQKQQDEELRELQREGR